VYYPVTAGHRYTIVYCPVWERCRCTFVYCLVNYFQPALEEFGKEAWSFDANAWLQFCNDLSFQLAHDRALALNCVLNKVGYIWFLCFVNDNLSQRSVQLLKMDRKNGGTILVRESEVWRDKSTALGPLKCRTRDLAVIDFLGFYLIDILIFCCNFMNKF
jgi:hypothetical protein